MIPKEVYAVAVKIFSQKSEEWFIGPSMYGQDIPSRLVGPYFMCKENAEELYKATKKWRVPNSTKIVRYVLKEK